MNIELYTERAELKAELAESAKILEDQRRHNIKSAERIKTQNRMLSDLGLNESEALEYALMLSRETAQQESSGQRHADEGVFLEDEQLEAQGSEPGTQPIDLDPALDSEESNQPPANIASSSALSLSSDTLHTYSAGSAENEPGNIIHGSLHSTSPNSISSTSVESVFPALSSSFGSSARQSQSPRSQFHSSRSSPSQSQQWDRRFTMTQLSPSPNNRSFASASASSSSSSHGGSVSGAAAHSHEVPGDIDDDLRYALELSLAEAESQKPGSQTE